MLAYLIFVFLLTYTYGQDCDVKFQAIDGHSACLEPSSKYVNGGVSEDNKTVILDYHNEVRRGVTPTAANMPKMVWDDEVAMIAQKWATQCKTTHDTARKIPGRFSVGQNMASGASSWNAAIAVWANEGNDFEFGTSNELSKFGHYTQMVWAKTGGLTAKVGCGFAECGDVGTVYVCNYGVAGNVGDISEPYTSGTTCEECTAKCVDKLCDCDGKVCENGGTLDQNTCTCNCDRPEIYIGENCQLNCSCLSESCAKEAPDDMSYCSDEAQKCSFSNVPPKCPWKCQACPYADPRYKGGFSQATRISTQMGVILVSVALYWW